MTFTGGYSLTCCDLLAKAAAELKFPMNAVGLSRMRTPIHDDQTVAIHKREHEVVRSVDDRLR